MSASQSGSRVVIVYPRGRDNRFDWSYYVDRHLPLAVGTSMRHSAVTHCDCDRPLDPASDVTAVCIVHFRDRDAVEDFSTFFGTGHPESLDIVADEPNYTDITPRFMGATWPDAPERSGPFIARVSSFRTRTATRPSRSRTRSGPARPPTTPASTSAESNATKRSARSRSRIARTGQCR